MTNKNKPQNRLRELRVAKGLSQTALAARAGLGLGTVNRIERCPSRRGLGRMAAAVAHH